MKSIKIAHRGFSGKYPENTLLAFQKALKAGFDGVELDVHLTNDGEIIVFHDFQIVFESKKTDISRLSLAEIKTIKLPCDQKIPKLSKVFDLIDKKCFINIELKGNNTATAVVNLIQKYINDKNWTYNHFLISSFDKDNILETYVLDPKIRIAILEDSNLKAAINFAKVVNAFAINPHFKLLNQNIVNQMQLQGLKVFPWTVNEKSDLEQMASYNVDGVISDFPDRI